MDIYVFAAVIACWWIWEMAKSVWLRPRRMEQWLRAQGLKANPYRLWYGDLNDITELTVAVQSKPISVHDDIAPFVLPFYHLTLSKYGKRSYLWDGPSPRIMIMEAEMIKEIYQKSETFVKLYTNPQSRLLIAGLVSYEGPKWAKHRQLLSPSFTVAQLRDMVPTMLMSCNVQLVDKLETMLSNTRSREVDVWPILISFTADIISRTAFGSNYEQGQKIFWLQKEQSELILQLSRSVYIPGFRFLPTKINRRLKEIDLEIMDVLGRIIGKKLEGTKVGEQAKMGEDMLGMMLKSTTGVDKEDGDRKYMGISFEDVMDECKLFYFAGQETTSDLLVWTMIMLSIHPKWQMEAREEIFKVFGTQMPDFDGLPQLRKINMILHEVLRLYPPVPTMLRTPLEDTKIGDITLPRGVEIVLPTLLVHHDKDIWGEDAKEFNPERFAQGVANAAKGQFGAFFPFGLGNRICLGMNFAMMEAKLALTVILQRFSFELSPSYEHAPTPMLTLQPKFGAKILLSKI